MIDTCNDNDKDNDTCYDSDTIMIRIHVIINY